MRCVGWMDVAVYDLQIRVVECKGLCPVGHKTGDTFLLSQGLAPSGLCMTALSALVPAISVLMLGASFPWEDDPACTVRACQDYRNSVIFEVRRVGSLPEQT